VTITAPATLASDYTLTLPTDDGGVNQVLQTDGSGGLSWATVASTVTTTRGDLIKRGASADERLAVGTANQVLKSDGTDPSWGLIANANIDAAAAISGSKIVSAATSTAGVVTATTQSFSGDKTFNDALHGLLGVKAQSPTENWVASFTGSSLSTTGLAAGSSDTFVFPNGACGLLIVNDTTAGTAGLLFISDNGSRAIISDPNATFTLTDPGGGGNKIYLNCTSSGQITFLNRFGVAHNIRVVFLGV
jgi:hypothetical protein